MATTFTATTTSSPLNTNCCFLQSLSPSKRIVAAKTKAKTKTEAELSSCSSRRHFIAKTATLATTTTTLVLPLISTFPPPPPANAEDALSEWERVYLPIDPGVVLLDIAFVADDPNHGFLLGTRQTIMETKDSGNTWVPRSIPSAEDEDFNYRFNSISFKGKEGWIVGKPAILLYTSDAGDTWERIPLSSQLPGDMVPPLSLFSSC